MHYPKFYDEIEPIVLYDPLSDFLGAFEDGIVSIRYLDCVKLAGHSCPTVAGAFLAAKLGLQVLYGDMRPVRSDIEVAMRDSKTSGTTGVTASVIGYIVGASDEGGFQGIGSRFNRASLLTFDTPMDGQMRLTRRDTGQTVEVAYDPSVVPADVAMKPLMMRALQKEATNEEKRRFQTLWQERVETILTSPKLWDNIITIKEIPQ